MTASTDQTQSRLVPGKPRVHVTRRLLPSVEARMNELFDVVLNTEDRPLSRAELITAMCASDVIVPTVTDRIDAEMLSAAGDRLGLIANFGAGIEHIDLAAARGRKIIVTNTPGVFTDDTADLTMMLILSVPRRLVEGSRLVREGAWTGWTPTAMLGHKASSGTASWAFSLLGSSKLTNTVSWSWRMRAA